MFNKLKTKWAEDKKKLDDEYQSLHLPQKQETIDYGDTIYIDPPKPLLAKINSLLTGNFYKKGWVKNNNLGGVKPQNKASETGKI